VEQSNDPRSITNAPASRTQRAELERIAFGRTHSREDEEAAAAARHQLAHADREAVARHAALSPEVGSSSSPEVGSSSRIAVTTAHEPNVALIPATEITAPDGDPPPPPETPRKRRRRIRLAWLIPIIAGSVAIGYIGAPDVAVQSLVGASVSTPPSAAPIAAPSASPGVTSSAFPIPSGETIAGPSSLKEADAWFETPPTERDGFVDQYFLQTLKIDPSAVRFVQINAAGFQVWVAKTLDDDLCVLSSNGSKEYAATCTPRATYSAEGLVLAQRDYSIRWTGGSVTVSSPRSQLVG
jgi:hypothetical protein